MVGYEMVLLPVLSNFFQEVFVIHKMKILQLLRKAPVQYQAVCTGKEGVDWISASGETCHFLPVPPPPPL